jgi:hypothetical protein
VRDVLLEREREREREREKELSYPNYKKYMIRRSMAIGPACTYGLPSLNNLRRRQAKATPQFGSVAYYM